MSLFCFARVPRRPRTVSATDGVRGITPGGRPGNVSLVFFSGLKRSNTGGYFNVTKPSSSGVNSSARSSSPIAFDVVIQY